MVSFIDSLLKVDLANIGQIFSNVNYGNVICKQEQHSQQTLARSDSYLTNKIYLGIVSQGRRVDRI